MSYITFTTLNGNGAISGLTYNYDGITDGKNEDLSSVPVPAAAWLFGSVLLGFMDSRRQFS